MHMQVHTRIRPCSTEASAPQVLSFTIITPSLPTSIKYAQFIESVITATAAKGQVECTVVTCWYGPGEQFWTSDYFCEGDHLPDPCACISHFNIQLVEDWNMDAGSYTFVKLDPSNPDHKKMVNEYLLWEGEFGKEVADGKIFK